MPGVGKGRREPDSPAGDNQTTLQNVGRLFLRTLNVHLTNVLAIPLPGICPRTLCVRVASYTNIHSSFIFNNHKVETSKCFQQANDKPCYILAADEPQHYAEWQKLGQSTHRVIRLMWASRRCVVSQWQWARPCLGIWNGGGDCKARAADVVIGLARFCEGTQQMAPWKDQQAVVCRWCLSPALLGVFALSWLFF